MKILFIGFTLASGGTERFVTDLCNELAKTNDVTLMILKDTSSEPAFYEFYRSELSEKVKYINLGLPMKGYNPLCQFKIYRKIKELNPDVVHMNACGIPKFCYLANLLLGKKMTFVQTLHSDLYNGYVNKIYEFVHATIGKSGKLRMAALSETNMKQLTEKYPHFKAACIVNGRAPMVPTDKSGDVKAEIENLKKNADTTVFLHVARYTREKNQTLLIGSFNRLVEKGTNAILLVIGASFDTEEGRKIKEMAGPGIHFLGTRKNIADYMLNSDVFVLSSNFEGMPIAIIEATLCGMPVVSTPVGGVAEAVFTGNNGIITEDLSEDNYLRALEDMCRELPEYKERAMKMKGNSPFTMAECARKYLEFYNA